VSIRSVHAMRAGETIRDRKRPRMIPAAKCPDRIRLQSMLQSPQNM